MVCGLPGRMCNLHICVVDGARKVVRQISYHLMDDERTMLEKDDLVKGREFPFFVLDVVERGRRLQVRKVYGSFQYSG